jgi:hypothetical protein
MMNILSPYVGLVELLGPGNPVDDKPCSGRSWALLTASFLRGANNDQGRTGSKLWHRFAETSPGHGVGGCCVARRLRSGRHVPPKKHRSNKTGSCKGHQSTNGGALRQACTASHESIVDLPLQPCYEIKKNGLLYEEAVSQASPRKR